MVRYIRSWSDTSKDGQMQQKLVRLTRTWSDAAEDNQIFRSMAVFNRSCASHESELRSCVKLKVEVDILMTSPSIIVLTVSLDVKQH